MRLIALCFTQASACTKHIFVIEICVFYLFLGSSHLVCALAKSASSLVLLIGQFCFGINEPRSAR